MIDPDSTQSAPTAPPHYELLSHPLVHYPDSPSYLGCLDILHNASYLLDLFQHLNLDDTSCKGGMSSDAAVSFYWLARMLEDTLRYVSHTLQAAWQERDAEQTATTVQQSAFFNALREPTGGDKSHIYSVLASCLNIGRADIEAFIAMVDGQPDSTPTTQDEGC
ncbi:hypothetical protein FKG94_10120 [Exilibacterium tricleocarpae]|uniref:Uncharacterized protein n=1 Tax=Exilibacterium tricleocarpae TaxID=2591008 RepID=A0A545TV05_9GAMM|nr:hypothetical protein [Exilibacterium tricleocarpae]TQV81042.1 hypothetical protein FKG94_10120 [Exilibacterium tricleocarpae]